MKFNSPTRKLAFFKALIYGERVGSALEWILMEMGAIKGPPNRVTQYYEFRKYTLE